MTKSRRIRWVRPTRVVVALALGITATVVVAWKFSREAIYQRTQAPTRTWNAVQSGNSYWVYHVRRGTGWFQIDSNYSSQDLPDSDLITVDRRLRAPAWSKVAMALSDDPDSIMDKQGTYFSWRDTASGWPMLAMRFRERTARKTELVGTQHRTKTTVTVQYGHPIWYQFGLHNILPLRPMWPGFVVNTIVFAIIAYLMLALVGGGIAMLRVSQRQRKGLCSTCGYDLAGLTGGRCPECGHAYSPATIAAERDAAKL